MRTSDGFTFPVDVRVEYAIEPSLAPVVIAKLGDDREKVVNPLNSSVRAIFRNNAEDVKALDYVQQRSQQESQSLSMLRDEMAERGVSIVAVRIGDVGTNDPDLAPLLKTQTDREIALQEQITFQEQQRAAEQKKELTRTEQEAEEERRLATASYEVQIAEQSQQKRIIEAQAEAEAIQIEASARAEAFRLVSEQIGAGNAALVELLKIVGDNAIEITPRVMVNQGGGGQADGNAETVALIGTMLDSMVDRSPTAQPKRDRTTDSGQTSAAATDN
ncbi:MAG: SPFH domain-containing protein [Planctomycetota bacterium]